MKLKPIYKENANIALKPVMFKLTTLMCHVAYFCQNPLVACPMNMVLWSTVCLLSRWLYENPGMCGFTTDPSFTQCTKLSFSLH